jgi:F-box interacting protein
MKNCTINLPGDPYYRLIDRDCRKVVGSCNGLVCLRGYSYNEEEDEKEERWLRIWNPATRTLSYKLLYQLEFWKFAFGYDNSTDIYKVVALRLGHDMTTTDVQVLSFGNNVWRNIQSFPARLVLDVPYIRCVHLDCTLNWLATIKNGNLDNQFVIISLDLGTERHRQLLPPPSARNLHRLGTGVCVLMDSLCFYHDINRTDFVIWKMTKFGDEKSWTQFLKLNYHNLQIDFTFGYNYVNGDTVVFPEHLQSRATLYNLRNNTVMKTRVDKKINWSTINNYVESLVSTC